MARRYTKYGTDVVVPLAGWTVDVVKARVKAANLPADPLFRGAGGGKAYTSIQRRFPEVVTKAAEKHPEMKILCRRSRDGINWHSLRRRFATSLKAKGAGDLYIMELGGWKARKAMGRYLVAVDEQTAKVASITAAMFAPKYWKPVEEAAEASLEHAASESV